MPNSNPSADVPVDNTEDQTQNTQSA